MFHPQRLEVHHRHFSFSSSTSDLLGNKFPRPPRPATHQFYEKSLKVSFILKKCYRSSLLYRFFRPLLSRQSRHPSATKPRGLRPTPAESPLGDRGDERRQDMKEEVQSKEHLLPHRGHDDVDERTRDTPSFHERRDRRRSPRRSRRRRSRGHRRSRPVRCCVRFRR